MNRTNPEDHIGHTLEIINDNDHLILECKTCQSKLKYYNLDDMPTSITSISKGDLLQYFKTPWIQAAIREMTRNDMQQLASKMANDYCEQLFDESAKSIFTEDILPNLPLPDGYAACELCNQIILFAEKSPDVNACCTCTKELDAENSYIPIMFNIWTGIISNVAEKSLTEINDTGHLIIETNQFPVYGHTARYIGMFLDNAFLGLDTIDDMFFESLGNTKPDLLAEQDPTEFISNHKFNIHTGEASPILQEDYVNKSQLPIP